MVHFLVTTAGKRVNAASNRRPGRHRGLPIPIGIPQSLRRIQPRLELVDGGLELILAAKGPQQLG